MAVRILSAGSTLHGVKAGLAAAHTGIARDAAVATDHGHNIRDAVRNGTCPADVVLLPLEMALPLAAEGLLRDMTEIGSVAIGGVVREGSPAPHIATLAELREALRAADAVLLTEAPTGEHMLNVAAQLGIRDEVTGKLHRFATSTALNRDLVGRSDQTIGFGPETEIRAGTGVSWIGEIPHEVQIALPYVAAVLAVSPEVQKAREVLAILTRDPARSAFRHSGVRLANTRD